MAIRKTLSHDDRTREKIQTSQLVNRLNSFALGDEGVEISSQQMKAIEILLRKTLPDLQAVTIDADVKGEIDNNITVTFKRGNPAS